MTRPVGLTLQALMIERFGSQRVLEAERRGRRSDGRTVVERGVVGPPALVPALRDSDRAGEHLLPGLHVGGPGLHSGAT